MEKDVGYWQGSRAVSPHLKPVKRQSDEAELLLVYEEIQCWGIPA